MPRRSAIHDVYDTMPISPSEQARQRRHNQERLAELERESYERQVRLVWAARIAHARKVMDDA